MATQVLTDTTRIEGSYGIDAPYVPILSFAVAVAAFVLAGFGASSGNWAGWTIVGMLFLAQTGLYLYTTYRGKFLIWQRLIDGLHLTGTESALDVGCGRGMVLITTARALPSGHVTGVDLWRTKDQSGNAAATTQANADLNNVGARVSLQTADMTTLELPTAAYDVVTANVAIQNVKDRELRRKTIGELYRVTKPGGRILIVDIQYVKQYRADLADLGATELAIRNFGPLGWFGNPFFASKLVSATKPLS